MLEAGGTGYELSVTVVNGSQAPQSNITVGVTTRSPELRLVEVKWSDEHLEANVTFKRDDVGYSITRTEESEAWGKFTYIDSVGFTRFPGRADLGVAYR